MAPSGEDLMLGCNTVEEWKEKKVFTTEGDHVGAGFPLHWPALFRMNLFQKDSSQSLGMNKSLISPSSQYHDISNQVST